MVLQVGRVENIENCVRAMIDRLGELQMCRRVSSDTAISEPFMRDHSEFDSFAAFIESSPWSLSDSREIHEVPRTHLDEYVAKTTDFQAWDEMETQAAEEALVEQHLF